MVALATIGEINAWRYQFLQAHVGRIDWGGSGKYEHVVEPGAKASSYDRDHDRNLNWQYWHMVRDSNEVARVTYPCISIGHSPYRARVAKCAKHDPATNVQCRVGLSSGLPA